MNNRLNQKTFNIPDGFLIVLIWMCTLTVHIPTFILMKSALLNRLQQYLFLATFCLVFIAWFSKFSIRKNVNKLFFIAYVFIVAIMTILNNGSTMKLIYEIMKMCVYFFLVGIVTDNNKDVFWKHLYYTSILLLAGNLVVWILYPDGILYSENIMYFFDTANETPNYVIPLIAIVLIQFCERKFKFIEAFIAGAVCTGNVAMLMFIDCSTGKVAIVLFLVMVLFSKTIAKMLSPIKLYMIFVVLLILLVFVGVIHWFSFLIVDVLDESLTLHTRTLAWEYSKEIFKSQPIFGSGYLGADVKYSVLCQYTHGRFSHSHCEFFEFLLRSGAVGVVCVNSYLISVLSHAAEAYKKSKILQIAVITIFVFLIMSINETCFKAYFYLFIAVVEGFDFMNNEEKITPKTIEV